ncbi:hypothetical protein [Sphingomonas sp.]|uniref:hypothetical protein n=1 Tax=Sphingomonas sp. TaxID=28214 RepID=UPI003F72D6C2
MGKFLRAAAMIVGAVALAFTGIGLAAGLTLATATSFGIGVSASTLFLASGALSIGAGLLTKRPSGVGGGSQTQFSADPNAGVPYAMGRTATAGQIVVRRAADGFGSNAKNDLNDLVTVLSGCGPIGGFVSFTAEKEPVTFDASGNAIGKYHDIMFQDRQLGATPETSALQVTAGSSANPTGWTASHKLSGMAATLWRLRYDSKKEVFFQSGVPQPLWLIDGVRCYDPRKDSTFPGGSGSHRWDDESTWEWTENPYLHALTWCIGRHVIVAGKRKRIAGLGALLDQIIVPMFVEGANIADANGWKVGGVVYSRPDTKWNVLKLILQAGAGQPLRIGARIGCLVNTPRVSLATITAADIVGDAQLARAAPLRSKINTVIPRYRSPAHEWEIVPGGEVSVSAYIEADGDRRTKELEYPLVQNAAQAATLARYDIEDSREIGPGTFPLKPKWLNYAPGDCLTLDLPDTDNVKLLLLQRAIETDSIVTFTARSETDAKHAAALAQAGSPPPDAGIVYDTTIDPPGVPEWAVSGGGGGRIVLSGGVDNGLADSVIFEYREAGGDWVAAGIEPPTITEKVIAGLAAGATYEVGVRYRARGQAGGRLVVGPVDLPVLELDGGTPSDVLARE